MTSSRPLTKAFAVFEEVVQRSGDDRRRRMEELCGTDAALREAVEGLLENDERAEREGFLDSSPVLTMDSLPRKTVLDDFELIRLIGSGGMGVVYEAEQISLDRRRVAVKVLSLAASSDRRAVERFQNEARWAARLQHRNIVPVFAVGEAGGALYYAMQLILGHDLAHLIERWKADASGPSARRMKTLANLALQAAEGLEHAHEMGLIHRDVKPGNLLLDERSNLWIVDFGLARLRNHQQDLTQTAGLHGTLRYMSPEQVSQGRLPLDRHTDIYSLGVTMYELMTLRPPFDDRDPSALLRRIEEEEPKAPRRICADIPEDLETITIKAMAKDAVDRYHSAEELAEDLRRFLNDEPILGRPPSLLERERRIRKKQRTVVEAAIDMLDEWFSLHPTLTEAQRQFLEAALTFYHDFRPDDQAEPDWLAKIADADRRVGEIERRLDRLEQAERAYGESVRLAESLVLEHPNDLQLKKALAQSYSAQGALYSDTGRAGEAEQAFSDALSLCERLSLAESATGIATGWQGLAIVANLNLGSLYQGLERTTDAEARYREAAALSKAVIEASPSKDARPLQWLAISQYRLGFALEITERYPEADQCYEEALRAAEEVLSAVPESGLARTLVRDLIRETYERELVTSKGGLLPRPSIEPLYRRAVKILEGLAARCPLVPEYRLFLGIRYNRYGNMLAQAGRLQEAEDQHRSAITTFETLLSEFPSLPEHRESLADSEDHLADVLQRIGSDDEAEQSWRRAIQLREQLVADAPQIPNHRRLLAEDHDRFAQFLIEKGRKAEAEEHLRRARELA